MHLQILAMRWSLWRWEPPIEGTVAWPIFLMFQYQGKQV